MSISKSLIPEFNVSYVITPPKHLRSTEIALFLKDCEKIFEIKGELKIGFLLDLTKVKKTSLLGVLVLYKIVEYSVNNGCFERPLIKLEATSEIGFALEKYGFTNLILSYIEDRGNIESQYRNLKVSIGSNFIIAAHALIREDKRSKEEVYKRYLPQIENYYRSNQKVVSMILLVFSEVLLNFWEHAVDDTKSIIAAYGNSQYIEIACADTGKGIISTLGISLSQSNLSPTEILQKALQKGVTSKQLTNHMGYGLWIIDQITTLTKGRLHLYSEGTYYYNDNGTKKFGNCGYWQGSIINIQLPLQKPKTLEDLVSSKLNDTLKINWV